MVLASKLGGNKSLIILGGVDTAKDKSLKYGIWLSRWKSVLLRFALQNADRVFAVDKSLITQLNKVSGWKTEKVEVLPTGFDSSFWKPKFPKEKFVLTVANCYSKQRLKVKGIDIILEAARKLPNTQFSIVGIDQEMSKHLENEKTDNLQLIPPKNKLELMDYYSRAKVYCQASRHEGLPNTLCEAMLCGCIPVGTDTGGTPTAISKFGFIVNNESIDELCKSIEKAFELGDEAGLTGRQHIAENFDHKNREKKIIEIINNLAGKTL
jgi:glycosyltransferase involved in cell wall biosynthesis